MLKSGYIKKADLDLVTVTDDPHEATEIILDYMRRVGPPETRPHILG
jgi:predicted Rossmann-fold nucleotide-binding protein